MPPRVSDTGHPAPRRLIKYLDPGLPAEAFSVSGVGLLVQAADPALRRLVRAHWAPFAVPASGVRAVRAVFQFSDGQSPPLPRLRRWHAYTNDRLLFLSDGKRYLLTGSMYDAPWQFHCRSLPDWDAEFAYYYVLEPLILDVLKRQGVLIWHSAAVAKGGGAILLPGVSGSGKSTTTLNLLSLGYRFIADDQVLLRARGAGLEVLGYESGLHLTDRSLRLLPEWGRFKRGGRHKKGRRWKHRIDLRGFRPRESSRPPVVKCLLFPRVAKTRETRLEELTPAEALLECLGQPPKEYPASVLGRAALEGQFELYSRLIDGARAFRIHLGADQQDVRAVLSRLMVSDHA